MSRFADRVVFVSGSTGMAASAARALAAEGARVFVASHTEDHARGLAEEIGGSAAWATADLGVEADVETAFERCVAQFGRLDGLYHVAGISGRRFGDGLAHEATLTGWETVLRTNATSAFLATRAALRRMLSQEPDAGGSRGSIVLMSSVLARHPSPELFGTHAYAASKGAIEAFTRATAAAYAGDGIRINAVAPALVATPMSRRAQDDPAIVAYLREKQPLAGGPVEADAVTPLVLALLGPETSMVTGQVIDVDGGWGVSEPRPRD